MNHRIDIQTCRDQHVALRLLVEELDKCGADEARLLSLLSRFKSVLTAHLKLEDNWLYPKLSNSIDGRVATKARDFQEEMGGLKAQFAALYERWSEPGAIGRAHETFCEDWKSFSASLERRMQREDDDLYHLAEQETA